MTKIRKQYSEQFKFKVAVEAIKGLATINEIASRFQVHPNQVRNWKKQLTEDGPTVFERKSGKHHQTLSTQEAELYEQIGRLKMELEWLKKKLPESIEAKCKMIETNNPKISLRRQCSLVGLSRATYYWQPAGESEQNLKLMRMIDQEYTRTPFYGSRKITVRLNQQLLEKVSRKRVVRCEKWGYRLFIPIKRPRFLINNTKSTPIYCGI